MAKDKKKRQDQFISVLLSWSTADDLLV